jgi:radical SAM superfamily enzyme YgiQ (UPF0313 family)
MVLSDNWDKMHKFAKTGSNLRMTRMLRKLGYEVRPIHHCMAFSTDDIARLIDRFAGGERMMICISSSFLITMGMKNTKFVEGSTTDPNAVDAGDWWGSDTFTWLVDICRMVKSKGHIVVLGGWAMQLIEFVAPHIRHAWGLDILSPLIDCFISGNNMDIVDKICRGEPYEYKVIKGTRIADSSVITDFSDCSSEPDISDHIMSGEGLTTEIASGCIFSCSFCDYGALGKRKKEFVRSYDSLKAEMVSNWDNFGTKVYTLTDNIINDWDQKLKYLIRIREETGIDIRWVGYVRLDSIKTKEQAQLIADSGCAGSVFGIESMKKEVGPYIGKMTDKKRLIEHLNMFRDAVGDDCLTMAGYITGLPTETKDEVTATYEWLQSKEGRYLVDTYNFSGLFIYSGNDDKNDINRARNHPYRDYERDPAQPDNPKAWVSPWGHYGEYADLARYFNENCKNHFGGFAPMVVHNLGIDIRDVIRIGRTGQTDEMRKVYKRSALLIEAYKRSVLRDWA